MSTKYGADESNPNGQMTEHESHRETYPGDFSSDEGGFFVDWAVMKRWNAADIKEVGQDAIDIEVLELANELMRASWLRAHPLHKERDSDLGLWKGKILVRTFRCPMWYRFNCDAEIRIQEGPGGLLMQKLGTHNEFSHRDPDDEGPILRFLRGKKLIQESDIPEAVAVRLSLGQSPYVPSTIHTAVTQHRRSIRNDGSAYQYVPDDDVLNLHAPETDDEDEDDEDTIPELCPHESDDDDDDYMEVDSHTTRTQRDRSECENDFEGDMWAIFFFDFRVCITEPV